MPYIRTIHKEVTMTKALLATIAFATTIFATEIPTQHAELRSFGKSIELNSKVIQLSNAKQSVTSLVSGHLEKYFIKAGQSVKEGQKIALIESIEVSKMTANYISYKKQFQSLSVNYEANKKLYEKGMISMQELSNFNIQKNSMSAKLEALRSQLHTLEIDTKTLKEATSKFILYAHNSGKVSKLHKPLHAVIREDETLISIIKDQAFYIQSYLPLEYASVVKIAQKLNINYNAKIITTHITQILPELDLQTQRIVVLSSVDEKADDLFINTFVSSTLYFEPKDTYVSVKKSALSFFNNEWVIFIPKHEEDQHDTHDDHDDHEGHDHDAHEDDHDEHKEDAHDAHNTHEDEHDAHQEDEPEYEVRVVEIITQDDTYVALRGIEVGEEYVSQKSYFVKSMLLKSSLGEHGH